MDDASMSAMGLSSEAEAAAVAAPSASSTDDKCRHPVAVSHRAFAGATASATGGARVSTNVVGEVIDAATYGAAFTAGLLEGSWSAVVDLFEGAADMIELVAKTAYQLITANPAAVKDMLMGWVAKLKVAWANRSKIADDFMQKWESDDDWTRGNFQGEVLGWVMMTALLLLATAGAASLAAATGRWASVLRLLATVDALGDVTTYVAKLGRLPSKALDHIRGRFGKGDVTDPAGEAVNDAAKASGEVTEQTTGKRDTAGDLADSSPPSTHTKAVAANEWIEALKVNLTPDELAQYEKMKGKWKTPEEMQQAFGGDFDAARADIVRQVGKRVDAVALKERSLRRSNEIRAFVEERGLMTHPEVRKIMDRLPVNPSKEEIGDAVSALRNVVVSTLRAEEVSARFPNARVIREVKVWEEQVGVSVDDLKTMSRNERRALVPRVDAEGTERLYKEITDVDLLLVENAAPGGKSRILRFEQLKTGTRDTPADANAQNAAAVRSIVDAVRSGSTVRLEVEGKIDITHQIDLGTAEAAGKVTVGPAGKGFHESLGILSADLERLMKKLVLDAGGSR